MISFDNLKNGVVKLPKKEVYIDALEDTIEVQPVSLNTLLKYKDAEGLGDNDEQNQLAQIIVAESLSGESGLTLPEALDIVEAVAKNIHPAAFQEISTKCLEVLHGPRFAGK